MVFAKVADGPKVRLLIGSEVAKSDIALEETSKLARTPDSDRIAEDENLQQENRVVGRPPAAVLSGFWIEWFEPPFTVKIIDCVSEIKFSWLSSSTQSEMSFGRRCCWS